MRICVISTPLMTLPISGYGGLEIIAWQIAKGLAAKGHQVALVAPEGSWCPNVQVIPCGPAGAWDEKTAYGGTGQPNGYGGYWKHLPQFDAVVDHSWAKYSYLLKMEGVLKAPVLGVCHAPINTMYQQLPQVDKPCFVCISQDQANHFQALFGKEARVAYNGIDLDYYKPLGLPRSNRFLFLARFSSIKGPDICIEACLEAGVGLDLIGDTTITNEPELLAKCQKLADGKQIRIVGNQNRGSCVWWFNQAHAMIHPNQRFREPFGLAPVEAMACGCPVIGWRHGALPETVRHGETGWLVSSQQELVQTIKDVAQTQGTATAPFRQRCREWASRFSIEAMTQRYEALCREAIDGGW